MCMRACKCECDKLKWYYKTMKIVFFAFVVKCVSHGLLMTLKNMIHLTWTVRNKCQNIEHDKRARALISPD